MASSTSSTTPTSASAAASSAAATIQVPGNLKIVGVILAIASGVLIGSSFVFKKKGLLRAQAGGVAGEGVGYLKSPLWWLGMISSVIIALNGPSEQSVGQITQFQALFLSPGFLAYGSVLIAAALVIIFYFAPRYGKKSMLWYLMVCSMIGGISVSVTTGLGAAIVTTAMGDNQFKHWFIYFLIVFIAITLITEVYYLNVALALFNTAMVTPTYYVICKYHCADR
ncbi:hypothetical protein EW026_g6339 [Hermanssonia centrifuga]|uniref:Magnesium transporter n=1 Tax=Hermanssonia centrifuga TaxID=98765 RepID=A0A4S4KBE2_9APHY|nr:hypothetical protein EW026_g6339 [Hermanssonia centrifuga]